MKKAIALITLLTGFLNAATITDTQLLSGPLTLSNGTDTVVVSMSGAHAADLFLFTSQPPNPIVTYIASPADIDDSPMTFSIVLTPGGAVTSFSGSIKIGGVQNSVESWTVTSNGSLSHSGDGSFISGSGFYDSNSAPHAFGDFTFSGATSITLITDGAGSGHQQGFTGFSIDGFEVVPEPASATLLGLGGLALAARRKRA